MNRSEITQSTDPVVRLRRCSMASAQTNLGFFRRLAASASDLAPESVEPEFPPFYFTQQPKQEVSLAQAIVPLACSRLGIQCRDVLASVLVESCVRAVDGHHKRVEIQDLQARCEELLHIHIPGLWVLPGNVVLEKDRESHKAGRMAQRDDTGLQM